MGCEHEWEFLQTLWEVDRDKSTVTWGNSREYAYFTCHLCGVVEKRIVTPVIPLTQSKDTKEKE